MQQRNETAGQAPAPSPIHKIDVVVAALILAVCAFLYWATTTFDSVPLSLGQGVEPTTFPRLLLAAIALLALYLPFEQAQKLGRGIDLDSGRRERPKPIVFTTALLLIAIVALTPWLGNLLALVLACAALPFLWGERRYWILAPYAVVFPTLVVWFFASVLDVNFEPGFLGDLFG